MPKLRVLRAGFLPCMVFVATWKLHVNFPASAHPRFETTLTLAHASIHRAFNTRKGKEQCSERSLAGCSASRPPKQAAFLGEPTGTSLSSPGQSRHFAGTQPSMCISIDILEPKLGYQLLSACRELQRLEICYVNVSGTQRSVQWFPVDSSSSVR